MALSNMALLATLARMDRGDITSHGFRSTFRDWAAEQTSFPSEVVEMALAHAIESKTEAAYRRSECGGRSSTTRNLARRKRCPLPEIGAGASALMPEAGIARRMARRLAEGVSVSCR